MNQYEYVKAIVDCDLLTIEAKLRNNHHISRVRHDEDVSDWGESDIVECVARLLDLDSAESKTITVEYD